MVPLHNTPIVARKSFKIKYKIDSVHDDITRMAAFTKDSEKNYLWISDRRDDYIISHHHP